MKRLFYIFCLLSVCQNIFAQDTLPSYPAVLANFFYKYHIQNESERYINFAKKKDGWYVQKVNRLNDDSVLSEHKFWSLKTRSYLDLESTYNSWRYEDQAEDNIKEYLTGNATHSWIDYERCRYHGYKGWAEDMIKDFGTQAQLPDTLLEGLGRAYAAMANSYLWYQQEGGNDKNDSLQVPLKRMQIPSGQRLGRVAELINKSVECFDRLLKQNPAYNSLIGNIQLKKFNEAVHGYMLMIMAMDDEKAAAFMRKAELAEPYIKQAKNYLNSCDKNAILFTYGDNDTYQLWYAQEREHFRKDVTVINLSLLGMPVYVDMIKKRKLADFSATPAFYSRKEADVSYFKDSTDINENLRLDLAKYLKFIYAKKAKYKTGSNAMDSLEYSSYPTQKIRLQINTEAFNKMSTIHANAKDIMFEVNEYTYLSDLIMLDIISTNINKRPIYFASEPGDFFSGFVLQQGIAYRLFPFDDDDEHDFSKDEIKELEKFADNVYQPVVSFKLNNVKVTSTDGNNVFFQLYSKLADYYADSDPAKAEAWLTKASRSLQQLSKDNMPAAYYFANSYLLIDKTKSKNYQTYMELYAASIYDKYARPSATKGYLLKEDCLRNLQGIAALFKEKEIKSGLVDGLVRRLEKE